jgi:hypothetical protein
MTVRHVAAHVRHVDVPVGMLRVRLGLADEHAALKAAHICVPWSLDDHHAPESCGPRQPTIGASTVASFRQSECKKFNISRLAA